MEGADAARTADGGRGNKARRDQRATADTAAGDYVACRRGTVSSYLRRPPCSDWPGSLPRKRTLLFPVSLSLSPSPPLSLSTLLSSLLGPVLRPAFSNRVPPFFFIHVHVVAAPEPSSWSPLDCVGLPDCVLFSPRCDAFSAFFLFRSPWLRFVTDSVRHRRHGRFRFRRYQGEKRVETE